MAALGQAISMSIRLKRVDWLVFMMGFEFIFIIENQRIDPFFVREALSVPGSHLYPISYPLVVAQLTSHLLTSKCISWPFVGSTYILLLYLPLTENYSSNIECTFLIHHSALAGAWCPIKLTSPVPFLMFGIKKNWNDGAVIECLPTRKEGLLNLSLFFG